MSDPLAELRALVSSEKTREAIFERQPDAPLAIFLRRVGAYVKGIEDSQDPENAYGGGGGRMKREAQPLDASMPFEEYRHLMTMGRDARILVAAHPSTPVSALLELAADPDRFVAAVVARRASVPAEVVRVLACHADVAVLEMAAALPGLDQEAIERLSRHENPRVRKPIAGRSDIPDALFVTLAPALIRWTKYAAQAIANDPRLTPELRALLPKNVQPRPKKSPP